MSARIFTEAEVAAARRMARLMVGLGGDRSLLAMGDQELAAHCMAFSEKLHEAACQVGVSASEAAKALEHMAKACASMPRPYSGKHHV